ncbi:MAG TPA: hypothetical protein VGE66_14240 [Chitinophagaceae bacterium]
MRLIAFGASAVFALPLLVVQLVQAQAVQARYDVLPIESGIYRQTVNVYVYNSQTAPAGPVSLPVVYVPLADERDRAGIERLEAMMQQGTLPYMRIVGIERSGRLMPARESMPAVYADPKGKVEGSLSDDEWFGRFMNSEVVPAVEGKYRCNSFKALYVDEGTPLGKYLLSSRSGGFSAYLTPTPLVWYNGGGRPESANTFQSFYAGLRNKEAYLMAAELDNYLDEYFLKTGRLPRTKE